MKSKTYCVLCMVSALGVGSQAFARETASTLTTSAGTLSGVTGVVQQPAPTVTYAPTTTTTTTTQVQTSGLTPSVGSYATTTSAAPAPAPTATYAPTTTYTSVMTATTPTSPPRTSEVLTATPTITSAPAGTVNAISTSTPQITSTSGGIVNTLSAATPQVTNTSAGTVSAGNVQNINPGLLSTDNRNRTALRNRLTASEGTAYIPAAAPTAAAGQATALPLSEPTITPGSVNPGMLSGL